jgi:hypothetical protein
MSEEEYKKFEESLIHIPYSTYKLGDFTTFSEVVNFHRFLLNKVTFLFFLSDLIELIFK